MDVQIYTKICLHCVYQEKFNEVETLMNKAGIIPEIIRTQYLPKAHEEATKIYGRDDYVAFVYIPSTKKVFDFTEFINNLENGVNMKEEELPKTKVNIKKSKPVKASKKK